MYDVEEKDIVNANRLKDADTLEKGQRLLIPNAAPLRSVIPLYPSRKWDYIIIHHSATDVGNALDFDYVHTMKQWKGLGYHFVIDNGTAGKKDGHIEVAPRWIHQEDGAHCKADGMNYKGIGICLVGNFSVERVTSAQIESLLYLANVLKDYYNIPNSHILGHGQVKDAITECPGKYFPWDEFRSRLNPRP
jgi:N-acetyl-anhydromuramyl-L-alanine amidase AmpD